MSVKKSAKKFKKIKKPEESFELRDQWITAFEDLDRELEKICAKMKIQLLFIRLDISNSIGYIYEHGHGINTRVVFSPVGDTF